LTQHLVIIGAGVSGLSAALALLRRGHGITVLERGAVGRESSWAGGGILSPLLPWDYAPAVSALALGAMATYPDWVAMIEAVSGRDAEYWRCGMQVLDAEPSGAAQAWCAAHALALVPGARHARDQARAFTLPGIAQVRNPRLMAALLDAVRALGGRVVEHAGATGLTLERGRAVAVRTADALHPADAVVLATGAWAATDVRDLSAVPGIRPVRGQMLLYRLAPGALDTLLFRDGTYLIPRRDGHVLVGSTLENAGFDKATTRDARMQLQASAAIMLPQLADLQPVMHWSGLRPGAPDNIPLIDRHPDADNVWLNLGHYRYGVTMAPASADLLADLIEGKPPALDPAPYRWDAALARHW
jgi:glycine oxidase